MKKAYRILFASLSIIALSLSIEVKAAPDPAKDIANMLASLAGNWKGDVTFYDNASRSMKKAKSDIRMSNSNVPSVLIIESTVNVEGRSPAQKLEVMVTRADGAMIRQMLFEEGRGWHEDLIVLDYTIKDEGWTLTVIEVREGKGGQNGRAGPGLKKVHFDFNGRTLRILKTSEYGTVPERKYDSLAILTLLKKE